MFVRALCAVAVALSISSNAAADVGLSQIGLDEALKKATAQKKAVLIEFSTAWCTACRDFENDILKNWKVDRALNDIVFLRYDADEIPGQDAASRYNVRAYPTFLAIDANGIERFRRTLADLKNVQSFVDLIAETRALFEDESVVRQRLKDNPGDAQTKLEAAKWYVARNQSREAVREFDAVAKTKASASEKAEASRLADHYRRVQQWKDQLVKSSVKSVRANLSNANVDELIIATIGSGLTQSEIQRLYKDVFKAHADRDALGPYVYLALAAGLSSDAQTIAEELARQTTDPKRMALLAECRYANGDRTEALEKLDEAIAVAKGTPLEPQLKQDRARIDVGSGDSSEVISARMKASDLWQRLEALDRVRDVSPPRPVGGGLFAVVRAADKLGFTVGQKCASEAAGANRAYAMLDIDNLTGQVTSIVLYLRDSSNQRLRDCLEREFRAAQLPIITKPIPTQSTTIIFRNGP